MEDRRTYQCHPSYATIGKAVGMSRNTVRKYVQELEERGLIVTERTSIITQDGRKQNGSLLYTILPIQFSIDQFYQRQLDAVDRATERQRVAKRMEQASVKQQICFSASCCCDRKNRVTHRCEDRYGNKLRGSAEPRRR
ncbi:MAG: helix-turn-helix domain-containing protein [Oscillospiraceae bacterium]